MRGGYFYRYVAPKTRFVQLQSLTALMPVELDTIRLASKELPTPETDAELSPRINSMDADAGSLWEGRVVGCVGSLLLTLRLPCPPAPAA